MAEKQQQQLYFSNRVGGVLTNRQLLNDVTVKCFFLYKRWRNWYNAIHCTYKWSYNWLISVLSQQKHLEYVVRPVHKFDAALYQAFLSLYVNTGIIEDWVKICPEPCKSVKVFKNDHSLLACQFWNSSHVKSVIKNTVFLQISNCLGRRSNLIHFAKTSVQFFWPEIYRIALIGCDGNQVLR